MTLKARTIVLALGLVTLLAGGALAVTSALASEEIESPYWKVGGKRLQLKESEQAKVKNAQIKEGKGGKEVIISGSLLGKGSATDEVRCRSANSLKAEVKGSEPFHDAGATLSLSLEGCTLWISQGEEKLCAVTTAFNEPAIGRYWYAGPEKERGTTVALVFTANDVATITLTGKACKLAGKYSLEGDVGALVSPTNTEVKMIDLIFPASRIEAVWQPQAPGAGETLELKLNGSPATVIGELELTLSSGVKFEASTKP